MNTIVTFGEVMLRLAAPGYLRFQQAQQFEASYGGGEANVAVSLANYGLHARFVTRLPSNDLSTALVSELRGLQVDTGSILYGGERLGIYFLETGSVSRASKVRSEEHTSELQSLMRISYAVFCLKQKKIYNNKKEHYNTH